VSKGELIRALKAGIPNEKLSGHSFRAGFATELAKKGATESEIMKKVDNFFKKLQKISNTKCEYIDERLTTFEAKEILGESKVAEVDAHAAKILIDNWIERSK